MIATIFYTAMFLYMIFGMTWRILCLFRKKGSCKFRKCPFRKDYTNMSGIYFTGSGCTKCSPTPEELEIYKHTVEGRIEEILKAANYKD